MGLGDGVGWGGHSKRAGRGGFSLDGEVGGTYEGGKGERRRMAEVKLEV